MSQLASLQNLDAMIMTAMARSGLADSGLYTSKDGTITNLAVRVYIDRDVQTLGDIG
jgi:hypothetical protein